MDKPIQSFAILAFFFSCWNCTLKKTDPKPNHYAVLGEKAAHIFKDQCSRTAPPDFEATWKPSQSEIDRLESQIGAIKRIKSTQCCILGWRIGDIHAYFRQYVGIVVQDRKLIYINAFRADSVGTKAAQTAEVNCDGGDAYWGALYDPKTGRFFDLAVNGEG